jgi:hypothetical protein
MPTDHHRKHDDADRVVHVQQLPAPMASERNTARRETDIHQAHQHDRMTAP